MHQLTPILALSRLSFFRTGIAWTLLCFWSLRLKEHLVRLLNLISFLRPTHALALNLKQNLCGSHNKNELTSTQVFEGQIAMMQTKTRTLPEHRFASYYTFRYRSTHNVF